MKETIHQAIADAAVVPAVKDAAALEQCLQLEQKVVFVLHGDICTIAATIARLHSCGKIAVVHADLITGLSLKEVAADFLKSCGADGVISTRPNVLRRAGELGLFTVLRFFVLDSMSLESALRTAETAKPDMVEILPGIMPRIVRQLTQSLPLPLLCGGLIQDKNDVMEALNAGAVAISSTKEEVWKL